MTILTGKTIGQLVELSNITDYTLFAVELGGKTYHIPYSKLNKPFTGNTSGECINDIYISNIHSCSPLNINPNDEGNVYFGSTSGITIDIENKLISTSNSEKTKKSVLSDESLCFHGVGDDLTNLATYENLTTDYNNAIFVNNKYYFIYNGLLLILNDDLSLYNEILLTHTQVFSSRNTLAYNQNNNRIYFPSQSGGQFLEYYDINTETVIEVEILDIDVVTNNQINLNTATVFYNNETEEVCFINDSNNVLIFDSSLTYINTIVFNDYNYFVDINYTTNQIYFRGDQFYSSPEGTLWNLDGFGDLSDYQTRTYLPFVEALAFQVGNNVLGAELVMFDTINNKYYKVVFSQWTQGGNGGGFSYTRELIINGNTFGAPVVFTKTNYGSEVDIIDTNLEITRGNAQWIFNSALEPNAIGSYFNVIRILDFNFNIIDTFTISGDAEYSGCRYNLVTNKFYQINTNPQSSNNEFLVYDINGNEEIIELNSYDYNTLLDYNFTISNDGKIFIPTWNTLNQDKNINVLDLDNNLTSFNITDLVTSIDLRLFSLQTNEVILINATNLITLFRLDSDVEFISCLKNVFGNNSEILLPNISGTIALTSQIPVIPEINQRTYGKMLFVDSIYGNDTTAETNNPNKPYLSIQTAINSASSGDLVVINTGTYNQALILKNGVDVYCQPNTVLNSGIVDNGTSVTCKVLGKPNINGFRAIYLTGQNSDVYIEGNNITGGFDGVSIHGSSVLGNNTTVNILANRITASGQYPFTWQGGYCNISIKCNYFGPSSNSAFSFIAAQFGPNIGTLNIEFLTGNSSMRSDAFGNFFMINSNVTKECIINMKFNEIIDNNPVAPNSVYRGVISSYGSAQMNINGNITSTGIRAGLQMSNLKIDSKINYTGTITTLGRECIIHANSGKLILNNATLIRNKINNTSSNYIIVQGSASGVFQAQNDNMLLEMNDVRMILNDSSENAGPASTLPLIFLTGPNSYTLMRDCSIYVFNPNPETNTTMDCTIGGGNVFFINTYSPIDKSINITELNTTPGYFVENNFKLIN